MLLHGSTLPSPLYILTLYRTKMGSHFRTVDGQKPEVLYRYRIRELRSQHKMPVYLSYMGLSLSLTVSTLEDKKWKITCHNPTLLCSKENGMFGYFLTCWRIMDFHSLWFHRWAHPSLNSPDNLCLKKKKTFYSAGIHANNSLLIFLVLSSKYEFSSLLTIHLLYIYIYPSTLGPQNLKTHLYLCG